MTLFGNVKLAKTRYFSFKDFNYASFHYTGWTAASREGFKFGKYLQVNFGNSTRVTRIALQHPSVGGVNRVTSYKVQYSDDGYKFDDGETVSKIKYMSKQKKYKILSCYCIPHTLPLSNY